MKLKTILVLIFVFVCDCRCYHDGECHVGFDARGCHRDEQKEEDVAMGRQEEEICQGMYIITTWLNQSLDRIDNFAGVRYA